MLMKAFVLVCVLASLASNGDCRKMEHMRKRDKCKKCMKFIVLDLLSVDFQMNLCVILTTIKNFAWQPNLDAKEVG